MGTRQDVQETTFVDLHANIGSVWIELNLLKLKIEN